MVGFADLRDARIAGVSHAADAWEQMAGKSRRLGKQVVEDLAGPLRGAGWAGDAADAAFAQMTSLRDEFELHALLTRNLATVLESAAVEFGRLQRNLDAAIDVAVSLGLTVHDDGRVSAPSIYDPVDAEAHRRAVQNAEIYTGLIRSIVEEANQADMRYSGMVAFLPDAGGTGSTRTSGAGPARHRGRPRSSSACRKARSQARAATRRRSPPGGQGSARSSAS